MGEGKAREGGSSKVPFYVKLLEGFGGPNTVVTDALGDMELATLSF